MADQTPLMHQQKTRQTTVLRQVIPPTIKQLRTMSSAAPLSIIGTLLMGLALSLAHHFMDVTLDGRQVSKVSRSQSWISRFSTALAFLVRIFLTISVVRHTCSASGGDFQ
jgi:hypothetical protein